MDFAVTQEQQMLQESARRLLKNDCSTTTVRQLLQTPQGYSESLWHRMADLGWIGLCLPEQYGGSGFGFAELAVLLEEMGRALLPSPFCATVLLGGYPILDAGSTAQRNALLPQIARGDLIVTMALSETVPVYDPTDINMRVDVRADEFLLNGVKLFVPYAHVADLILTVVRTSRGSDQHGLSLLLVNRNTPGVQCTVLKPIDDSKLCEVTFDNVRVPRARLLGEIDRAWPVIEKTLARAALGECLQLIGGGEVALEMSVQWAKDRTQFGQAIGTFQAVQHLCANMLTDLDGARLLTHHAAWLIGNGLPCAAEVAMAKGWVSEAALRIVSNAHQVLGGIGFIEDHDLTLLYKRTNAAAMAYGDANYHYRLLAQELGL